MRDLYSLPLLSEEVIWLVVNLFDILRYYPRFQFDLQIWVLFGCFSSKGTEHLRVLKRYGRSEILVIWAHSSGSRVHLYVLSYRTAICSLRLPSFGVRISTRSGGLPHSCALYMGMRLVAEKWRTKYVTGSWVSGGGVRGRGHGSVDFSSSSVLFFTSLFHFFIVLF